MIEFKKYLTTKHFIIFFSFMFMILNLYVYFENGTGFVVGETDVKIQQTPCAGCAACSTATNTAGDYVKLTTDISSTGDCITVGNDNVTFDCDGYSITGGGSGKGIYLSSKENVTIKNCNITNFAYGIDLGSSSNNSNLSNINSYSNDYGIYLGTGSSNNNLNNITASSNNYEGILLAYNSNYNDLNNITVYSNSGDGIRLSTNWYNNLNDITAYSNNYGIYLVASSNNTLTNITANSNLKHGILFGSSDNNNLVNIIASSNNESGIKLTGSNNNNLTSITASSNNESGIYLGSSSNNNTLTNSEIKNTTQYGISIEDSQNNIIYNNLFNNTNNVDFGSGTIYVNYWNTTKQIGTNIIGRNYLGGNFWANLSGAGFSENNTACNPIGTEGICANPYTLAANNIDYLPLTYLNDTTPPVITIAYPSNNANVAAGTTWTWINITTNENAACQYNYTNDFTFDVNGTNFTTTNNTYHYFNFTNGSSLANGKTYTLYYKCNDSLGNINTISTVHVFGVSSPTPAPPAEPGGVVVKIPEEEEEEEVVEEPVIREVTSTEVESVIENIEPEDLGLKTLTSEDVTMDVTKDTITKTEEVSVDLIDESLEQAVTPEAQEALTQVKTLFEEEKIETIPVSKSLTSYQVTSIETRQKMDVSLITIEFTAPETLEKVVLIETIPKTIAETTDEINFIGFPKPRLLE